MSSFFNWVKSFAKEKVQEVASPINNKDFIKSFITKFDKPEQQEQVAEAPKTDVVNTFVSQVLQNEGGYQADPADSGNLKVGDKVIGTNKGITPKAWAEYKGLSLVDINEDTMRSISDEEATQFYIKEYFEKPGFDKIEDKSLAVNVADMAVNAGPSQAVKILQRAVGVKDDGIIGPNTLAALEGFSSEQYSQVRKDFYKQLAKDKPKNKKFLNGWLARADKMAKETDNG